jgi:NTE family protein
MKKMEKVGLALGGGAALGAAHVGVLRAIDEFDIKIDYLAGTSIGAFIAALFAFGKTWKDIEKIALALKWIDITDLSLSKYGLLSNEKLGHLIIDHIGDQRIEDAPIPLAMIATDATTGKKVVLDKGSVADAVMASTCIPGIFKPVENDERMLLDGGIVENVPIETITKMGAEYVIAVDLNANYSYEKPQNILDIILNSFHFIMKQTAKIQAEGADLLIKPDLSAFSRSDIEQVEKMIKEGYDDATKSLKELS